MKHEIMWWMSRLTIMGTSLSLSVWLAAQAYAQTINRMGRAEHEYTCFIQLGNIFTYRFHVNRF